MGTDHAFYEKLPQLFPHADARSWFVGNQPLIDTTAFRNSSLQGAYLMLAARAVGLDCGPMSGFDNAGVDNAFFAGTTMKSNFLVNLGYGDRQPRPVPAQPAPLVRRSLPDRLRPSSASVRPPPTQWRFNPCVHFVTSFSPASSAPP